MRHFSISTPLGTPPRPERRGHRRNSRRGARRRDPDTSRAPFGRWTTPATLRGQWLAPTLGSILAPVRRRQALASTAYGSGVRSYVPPSVAAAYPGISR